MIPNIQVSGGPGPDEVVVYQPATNSTAAEPIYVISISNGDMETLPALPPPVPYWKRSSPWWERRSRR